MKTATEPKLHRDGRKPSTGVRASLVAAAIAGVFLVGVSAPSEHPVAVNATAPGAVIESLDATDNPPIGYFAELFLGRMGDAQFPQGL